MSGGAAFAVDSFARGAARCGGAREALIVVVMLYGLTQATETLAGGSSSDVVKNLQPIVGGRTVSSAFMPENVQTVEPQFATSNFRRLNTRALQTPESANTDVFNGNEPLRSTSTWQQLADYRSHGRVQLLTLWESPRSSVSLQAGKHGGPSLQWTSRLMNHGGATRGLLDRFKPAARRPAALSDRLSPTTPRQPATASPLE